MIDNNSQFKIMDTKLEKQRSSLKETSIAILLALAIAALLIIPTVSYLIQQNLQNTAINYKNNVETMANAKLEILDAYFDSTFELSNSIVSSDAIKIWLDEYNNNSENEIASAQKPYIKRTLQEFVEFNSNINNVALINNSQIIESYNFNKNNLSLNKNKQVKLDTKNNDILLTIVNPIANMQEDNVIANLVYTINATEKLNNILAQKANKIDSAIISILFNQNNYTFNNNVVLTNKIEISNNSLLQIDNLMLNNNYIYSTSTIKPKYGYKISYNVKTNKALASHNKFKYNLFALAGAIAVIISLFFLAMLWKGKNNQTRKLAKQYSKFAKELNKQQSMLEGINTTIDEQISLKNLKGNYLYINNAFSKFFNIKLNNKKTTDADFMKSEKIISLLNKADNDVIAKSKPWNLEQLEIADSNGTRYFDITKWPQKDGEETTGIITIARDRTEPILHQRAMEKLQNQSILALVKTVEIKDPHLAGHHARMAYIAELIAKSLKLTDDEITTLKYSAQLAGIGKVFVPQALLTKPGKLTQEELEIIQTHVLAAKAVLSTIDFSLPISQTIENMYERLDGSGYPMAKKAEEIGSLSRILAIADAFCALIVPRSYRDAISFEKALEILKQQNKQYDEEILELLEKNVLKMSETKKEFILNLK